MFFETPEENLEIEAGLFLSTQLQIHLTPTLQPTVPIRLAHFVVNDFCFFGFCQSEKN